jgi:hypothetical protein
MQTQCKQNELQFQDIGKKKVVVKNDGEKTSSDGGLIILREIEEKRKIIERFSECFFDGRNQKKITHSLLNLLKQRILGICLGYEDINDHEQWRYDPMLAFCCNRNQNTALAGKSTLNRMELPVTLEKDKRYKKISYNSEAIRELFIKVFTESYKTEPEEIILDLDATDDPLHGEQEGRFFHGYYDEYCYLPLYAFVGEHLLLADLLKADSDPGNQAISRLRYLIYKIREVWPLVRIIVRADSGFCRKEIMSFCESQDNVDYVLGLKGNSRLKKAMGTALELAKKGYKESGCKQRIFKEIKYKTKKSWSKKRRVIGKAEYSSLGENIRFVVTSIDETEYSSQALYEDLYCGRGNMENRIKEQQLYLFADRTSTHYLKSNQLRLWLSSLAYVLFVILRNTGLASTDLDRAQVDTIRLKLLKVSAFVKESCRRIFIRIPESFPYWDIWITVRNNLCAV